VKTNPSYNEQANEQASEQQLIDRARNGSVAAFEQLVLSYQDQLYRFLLARAKNRADAEDALQEAFVAAFRHLSSYRNQYRFSTWLFTIAIRQLARLSKKSPDQEELQDSMICESPGPEQIEIQDQNRNSLWQTASALLSDAQFTALWLFYVEDMQLAEIGSAMKRPVSWVKVNLMRARRRLRLVLHNEHSEHSTHQGEITL
jgi:RNA polymerase sigma-70 factor (ECF subfamily)